MDNILNISQKDLDEVLLDIIKKSHVRARPWTMREVYILTKLNGKVPQKEIARLLNRSVAAVNVKMARL